jgi:RNA polymerase sigma factor (sigma-70 family)
MLAVEGPNRQASGRDLSGKAMNQDAKQVLTELLVLSAQGGDENAFRELHALWAADLRRLALGRVERPDAAQEVANDAWLAIARGLRRLDDPACFPRWAFRIVERRGADWVRAQRVSRRRELAAAAEAESLAPASPPPAAVEPTDDVVALRAAIAALPADARRLLQLFYDHGRSVAEIADILAVPGGTVKSRLFSISETLKHHLERKLP